ncbi:SIR2 family protein [Dysgonomonas sp. GY617]|uniref:SIR2 family protein n=1 Tax=Dysgonomonas sp. GY617 TaxID=2780420 RepID=UPI00188379FF|nr:SIR2 family protein [Dysgonomonas sp. GY617]MBF0577384.1 SIR2 family protein [Dysgonomonas sp. GY617]
MHIIDKKEFLRSFAIRPNGSLNFLLGAGASVQANIPAAGTLIWQFKRKLFCGATNVREDKYKDLESERNRTIIQSYFEMQGDYPKLYSSDEYSVYFEKCYRHSIDRKAFVQRLVQGKNPSIGHKCLGVLFDSQKVNHIWTTNFDELIESGIKAINNGASFEVISEDTKNQLFNLNKLPRVIKLHGDYRYDNLQNTSDELKSLEKDLHKYFSNLQSQAGLIVIGYSGSDNSILEAFQETFNTSNPFPYGLIWCIRKGQQPNSNVISLIQRINEKNNNDLSGFIEIDGFDEFMFELYVANEVVNPEIENIAKLRFEARKPFSAPQIRNDFTPIKLNGLKARSYPKSIYSFKSDLEGWKELREIVENQKLSAALSKGNTLVFGSIETITKVFNTRIKSEIITVDVDESITYKQDSFYTGLIYDLIEENLISNYSLKRVPTKAFRKFYSENYPLTYQELNSYKIQSNIVIYEAVEIQFQFHNKELFLILLPSIHISPNSGLTNIEKQNISNIIFSNRRNNSLNERENFWISILKKENSTIQFSIDNFKLEFESNYSSAGIPSKNHSFSGAFQVSEPRLNFHITDKNYRMAHPLKGLKTFGPLDNSFESTGINTQSIKIAILSPDFGFSIVQKHLLGLNEEINPKSELNYLIQYSPFATIYKRYLEIPQTIDNKLVQLINSNDITNYSQLEFYDFLKRKIEYFYTIRGDFDVLTIYFPDSFQKFRELKNEMTYFDLHDSLKLFCAKKNIKIQIIEDKSINYYDPAKVRWWLSLGLYVKANGTPWRNETISDSTAFIGLDFSIQKINSQTKYVLGSSQIFDSAGQGLRFLLQPIEHPVFYGKNPFMSKEDARKLILKLKEAYYRVDGNSKLDRLVIHKVLHYTYDEMQGILEAADGIENVELLQIQKYSNWRAIRGQRDFLSKQIMKDVHNYPIQRGTVIQLDEYSFLLWTHGSVIDDDIAGMGKNYYQSGRGIPSPLLIRRFRGTDTIETTVKEILALTKMNWNGGELYKTLPVTLDFSKRLSRYAKQAESLHAITYDFRFFM